VQGLGTHQRCSFPIPGITPAWEVMELGVWPGSAGGLTTTRRAGKLVVRGRNAFGVQMDVLTLAAGNGEVVLTRRASANYRSQIRPCGRGSWLHLRQGERDVRVILRRFETEVLLTAAENRLSASGCVPLPRPLDVLATGCADELRIDYPASVQDAAGRTLTLTAVIQGTTLEVRAAAPVPQRSRSSRRRRSAPAPAKWTGFRGPVEIKVEFQSTAIVVLSASSPDARTE